MKFWTDVLPLTIDISPVRIAGVDAWVRFVRPVPFVSLPFGVGPFWVIVSVRIAQLSFANSTSDFPTVPIVLLALSVQGNVIFIRLGSTRAFVGVVPFPPLMTCEVVNREHSLGYTNYD